MEIIICFSKLKEEVMGRLVHFEIHVDDMDRAKKFYGEYLAGSLKIIAILQECHILEQ